MENSIVLKVAIPKDKQASMTNYIQEVGGESIAEWATCMEYQMFKQKPYLRNMRSEYKGYSPTNGDFIFHMKFFGTKDQLLKMVGTTVVKETIKMVRWNGGEAIMEVNTGSNITYLNYSGPSIVVSR